VLVQISVRVQVQVQVQVQVRVSGLMALHQLFSAQAQEQMLLRQEQKQVVQLI
jgi:hypothetical protein